MRKFRIRVFVLIGLGLIIGIILFLIGYFKPQVAGVNIETTPTSSVFIDEVLVGQTPYQETRKPSEVTIKLVPESFEKPLVPYETKVTLANGVETVIKWDFGESDETSTGEIISFEKAARSETSLSVVTIPDSAQIVLDSGTRAFAPYKTSAIIPGDHVLAVSATGYLDRSMKLKTHVGYKLTAMVKLAIDREAKDEEVDQEDKEEEKEEEIKVEILSTPTGFLRVRDEPSTLGAEVGRVEPEETYLLIEEDEETGWFKIEYEKGEEGWISDTYAEIIEIQEEEKTTPTPEETETNS